MVRLRPVLENSRVNLFVGVLLVRDRHPVHRLVFALWKVHNREFRVVAQLAHAPLQIVLVVSEEDLLRHHVAVRKLEYLSVQELLLLRNQECHFWYFNPFGKHGLGVFGELKCVEFLLFEFSLLHIDDLREEVVVREGRVVVHVRNLLLD